MHISYTLGSQEHPGTGKTSKPIEVPADGRTYEVNFHTGELNLVDDPEPIPPGPVPEAARRGDG